MLKLKLQYFDHLRQRAYSLEKTLMLGKIEGRRRGGVTEDEMVGWHHRLNGHEFEQALGGLQSMGSQKVRQDLTTEQRTEVACNLSVLAFSHSVTLRRFIQVIGYINSSFLFLLSCILWNRYTKFLELFTIRRHMDSFQLWAIMNKVAPQVLNSSIEMSFTYHKLVCNWYV